MYVMWFGKVGMDGSGRVEIAWWVVGAEVVGGRGWKSEKGMC